MPRLTDEQILTDLADGDWFGVVDVSDTAQSALGSTKRITDLNVKSHFAPAPSGYLGSPGLIKRRGFSTDLDQAMALFVTEAPDGGRAIQPDIGEGDEIVFGPGTAVMTATFVSSASSGSTFGMRWRGAGIGATAIVASGAAAAFRSDGTTWRMFDLRPTASGYQQEWSFSNLSLKGMFSPSTDAVRLIDADYLAKLNIDQVGAYIRSPSHRSVTQFAFYLKRCFYANLRSLVAEGFYVSSAGAAMNGSTVVGYGGVGLGIEECNALNVFGLQSTGLHAGALFDNDHGCQVYGAMMEHTNIGVIFRNGSYGCRVFGGYREGHKLDNGSAFGTRAQEAVAVFGATTRHNEVHITQGQSDARIEYAVDRSRDKSNRLVTSGLYICPAYSTKPLSATRTLSSVTEASSSDAPHMFSGQASTAITWPGNYGEAVYWPITLDPRCGTIRVLMSVKRISGDGMMVPLLTSVGLTGSNTVADGYLLDPLRRHENASASVPDIDVAAAGHSYSSSNNGEVTLTFKRSHLLQPGMRVQSAGGIGSMANSTNLYVRRVTSEVIAVFGIATGTLADPGSITTGSVVVLSDMYGWLGQPDCTRDWFNVSRAVPVSFNVVGVSLNGSNIPVITLDRTCAAAGITNTSALLVWGFNDSRLDGVAYAATTGDISGSTLTLTALGAMADLDVSSAADNGLDTTTVYGKIGFTALRVALIGKTTGTASCVWRVTEPVVLPGAAPEMSITSG